MGDTARNDRVRGGIPEGTFVRGGIPEGTFGGWGRCLHETGWEYSRSKRHARQGNDADSVAEGESIERWYSDFWDASGMGAADTW